MATSKKSTGQKLNDPTSSVAATPVSLSVRQANGEVKKIRATCGRGLEKPLADYDPTTQSWKMFGDISLWEDCPLLVNLPPSGMTRSGVLYLQPAWERITAETGSSSWPTPTADDASNVNPKPNRFKGLVATVNERQMWPTPTAHPDNSNINGKFKNPTLGDAVKMWPTPTYGKLAGGSGAVNKVNELYLDGQITDEERKAMQAGNGGKLNPTWVEWLMGFPAGWTDLEA